MTSNPLRRESPPVPVEYESIEVWPDEIRIGDVVAGYVVTGVHAADHYRAPAVRITIFTDPALLPDDVPSEEWGRLVLRVDRENGHPIPVERPRR